MHALGRYKGDYMHAPAAYEKTSAFASYERKTTSGAMYRVVPTDAVCVMPKRVAMPKSQSFCNAVRSERAASSRLSPSLAGGG